jgi:hypothetical protein
MAKKIHVEVKFDRTHEYVEKNGASDLTSTIGAKLASSCYGFVLTDGVYCELNGTEYIIMTAEICNAAHRLLLVDENSFMDEVFGAGFNDRYGVTSLKISDNDEVVFNMHKKFIEESW